MFVRTKILIIESHTPLAMMLVHLLTQAGCDASVARNGELGLKLANEDKFDLIVLDTDLPDTNGFEICRDLKQRHLSYRTPVVFISGRLLEGSEQRGLDLGAVDYIAKPLVGVDLASRLLSHVTIKPRSNLTSVASND